MHTAALFIGQAPPKVIVPRPFGRTHLYRWFDSVGISETQALQHFAFTALIDFFPGLKGSSHRPPSDDEITQSRPRLIEMITALQPRIIVPVGALSIREVLHDPALTLEQAVGKKFTLRPFGAAELDETIIIPIPHPSGASTWQYKEQNKPLLTEALRLLAQEAQISAPPSE